MSQHDAAERFKTAMQLFSQGKFAEALAGVDSLLEEYPSEVNLMAARARCLGGMNRIDEALQLCRELEVFYNHPQATEIAEWVKGLERDGAAAKSKNKKKVDAPARKQAENLAEFITEWWEAQPAGRLVFILILAGMMVASLVMMVSAETRYSGVRLFSCALVSSFLLLSAVHHFLPTLPRGIYTSGWLIGAISGAFSLQDPSQAGQGAVFLLGLVLMSVGSALVTMLFFLITSALSSVSWSFIQVAQESCFVAILLFSIGLIWFLAILIYGLIVMLLVIIGLKISTWITGMEEDDLSLMMTLDVYKEKMTRS